MILAYLGVALATAIGHSQVSVADYPSIQAALDANPGKAISVPAGDYVITEKIRVRGNHSALCGPGRIIQKNTEQPIIEIENAAQVEIRDLTLMRPDGANETEKEAVVAQRCRDLFLDNLKVFNNRTKSGAILVTDSEFTRISHCVVRNYMKVSIDDRRRGTVSGYAFRCTDGTGVMVRYSTGTLIEGNQIIESTFSASKEVRDRYKLGDIVEKNPEKGPQVSQQAWDAGYTDNWRQGSAIQVTAPETSDFTRVIGNHIENAAQGIDLHCDHVIVSNNIINQAHIGMKAMHGSKNVLITGNQFARNDLWAIGLMPGAAAHPSSDGKPENADGGSIISNNIISDFGHGDAHWMWGEGRSPFKFDAGQEADDPPLTDVLVQGNLVHNSGPPRYIYDVIIATEANGPRGMHFTNNVFPPGTRGICNQPMNP
ncbi:MAG: right-handed parallel beta-helix repeat-containing protein [Verrucomicrobiaceae bacterium]|nr:right-handed parallel beta-helix repeat-containing protein [Verrucomicrobiaceae bacterium]